MRTRGVHFFITITNGYKNGSVLKQKGIGETDMSNGKGQSRWDRVEIGIHKGILKRAMRRVVM